MYDHVLVPTDGSEASTRAAEHAISLAAALDSTIHALSVIEGTGQSQRDQLRTDPEGEARDAVDAVERGATAEGVSVTTTLREGPPAGAIRDQVAAADADLIVMGTDNRSGLDRVLKPSVAEDVQEHATIPVLTVPNPE